MKITESELNRIKEAVTQGERGTTGEIATALIKQSSNYAYQELGFSLIVAGIYFVLILIFHNMIESFLSNFFWETTPKHFIVFTGFSVFGVIGLTYVLSNIPCIDRLIIPNKIKDKTVYNRALRQFIQGGTCYTKNRTGILIFISLLERRVYLIADKGINDRIPKDNWDEIVKDLTLGIRNGDFTNSLIKAIESCSLILKREFPETEAGENELPNGLVLLEE